MNTYQLTFDDHTILIVDGEWVNYSFDHSFGTKTFQDQFNVTDVSINTVIGNIEYDVTKAMNQKQIEHFKEWAQEKLNKETR